MRLMFLISFYCHIAVRALSDPVISLSVWVIAISSRITGVSSCVKGITYLCHSSYRFNNSCINYLKTT